MQSLLLLPLLACSGSTYEQDLFGATVAMAHDGNEDGVLDLWIADPSTKRTLGTTTRGRVWLVCAKTGQALLEITAPEEAHGFGWTLTSVPDVDGDGIDDLAVGALFVSTDAQAEPKSQEPNYAPTGEGAVYLFSGAKGELLRSWRGAAETLKSTWYSSGAGPALATVGDWNGDGKCDLAIGWSYATRDKTEQGCVRVVSLADGKLIHEFWGAGAYDRFGFAITAIGGGNATGASSFAASALPDYAGEGEGVHKNLTQLRPSYVRGFAASGKVIFDVRSPDNCRKFGYSLSWIPASRKHKGRLAVGQSFYCKHGPAVHFLAPSDGKRLGGFGPPTITAWTNGGPAAHCEPEDEPVAESFGARIVPLRDFDGDGLIDVAVTAPQSFCTFPAAVFSSASGDMLRPIQLEKPANVDTHGRFQTHVGIAAMPVGDYNADDIGDFVIGGASIRCGGESCAGVVALYSGKDVSTLRWFMRAML